MKPRIKKAIVAARALANMGKHGPASGLYRVKLRRGEKFRVKPNAEQIDGKVFYFTKAWPIDREDSRIYVGEWAMMPRLMDSNYPDDAPGWLATGDLQYVGQGHTPECR